MNAFIAITRRDLTERRMIFVAALVAGFIPFLVQALRHTAGNSGVEARNVVAALLACAVLPSLALMLGGTMIGRDLSERRLSFYFARPINPATLWFAKLFSAFVSVGLTAALLTGPVVLVAHPTIPGPWSVDSGLPLLMTIITLVALIVFGHAFSTSVRSRSRWIAVDFAAAIIVGSLGWLAIKRIVFTSAFDVARVLMVVSLIVTILSFIAAGAWQLVRGRADKVQSHRAMSIALWTLLAGSAVLINVYTMWFVHVAPNDLKRIVQFDGPANGDWIWLRGVAAHRGEQFLPVFAYNVRDGRSFGCSGRCEDMSISADGRKAVALTAEFSGPNAIRTLYVADLTQPKPELRATSFTTHMYGDATMSPDGTRVAVVGDRVVSIYSIADDRTLATVSIPQQRAQASFIDNEHVLISQHAASSVSLSIFDVAHRAMRTFANVAIAPNTPVVLRGDRALGRVLLEWKHPNADNSGTITELREYDLATGAQTFARSIDAKNNAWAVHLADGTIAWVERHGNASEVVQVHRDGTEQRVALPALSGMIVRDEGNGRVLMALSQQDSPGPRQVGTFDLKSGRMVGNLRPDLHASDMYATFFASDILARSHRVDRQSLFVDAKGALVRSDIESGKLQKIVGGAS